MHMCSNYSRQAARLFRRCPPANLVRSQLPLRHRILHQSSQGVILRLLAILFPAPFRLEQSANLRVSPDLQSRCAPGPFVSCCLLLRPTSLASCKAMSSSPESPRIKLKKSRNRKAASCRCRAAPTLRTLVDPVSLRQPVPRAQVALRQSTAMQQLSVERSVGLWRWEDAAFSTPQALMSARDWGAYLLAFLRHSAILQDIRSCAFGIRTLLPPCTKREKETRRRT